MAQARQKPAAAEESFESQYAALEAKARQLEQGNLPLEESLKLYEEGAAIVDRLRTILSDAELRVRNIKHRLDDEAAEFREPPGEYNVDPEEYGE